MAETENLENDPDIELMYMEERVKNYKKRNGKWKGEILTEVDRQKIALVVVARWLKEGFV